jgi:hypothetical protein
VLLVGRRGRWEDLRKVSKIDRHRAVTTIPVFVNDADASTVMPDMAATSGVDFLTVGASLRGGTECSPFSTRE